jgi:tRNA A-37 threonylcarbamoyl transferase component Bud32
MEEIAGYRVVRELGSGASGVVYEAEDPQLARRVALKLLRSGTLASAAQLERFRREREALAKVVHPHVLSVHAAGTWRGSPYVVTELLPGRTLADLPRPLPVGEALRLATQIADGLGAIHAARLVHRDPKPANVLLDRQGNAKVADLGLAVGEGQPRLTKTGVMVGTPAYMAPEAFTGEPVRGPTADVYALGLVLYELLTGQVPHNAGSLHALIAQRTGPTAPDPRLVDPSLPLGVSDVCRRALARAPEERLADGSTFASALRGVDLVASRPAPGWAKATPVVLLAAFLIAVAGVLATRDVASEATPADGGEAGASTPVPRPQSLPPGPAPLPQGLRPLGQRPTSRDPVPGLSCVAWTARGLHLLTSVPTLEHVNPGDATPEQSWPLPDAPVELTCWDPGGDWLAFAGSQGLVLVSLLDPGTAVRLDTQGEMAFALAWRGSTCLVGTASGKIFQANAEAERPSLELLADLPEGRGSGRIGGLAVDDEGVVVFRGVRTLTESGAWDTDRPLPEGSLENYSYALEHLPPRGADETVLSYRPLALLASSSDELYLGTSGHHLLRLRAAAADAFTHRRARPRPEGAGLGGVFHGPLDRLPPAHDAPVRGLALSPDGRVLASIASEKRTYGELALWEAKTGRLIERKVLSVAPQNVAWDPAGGRLALSLGEDGLRTFELR